MELEVLWEVPFVRGQQNCTASGKAAQQLQIQVCWKAPFSTWSGAAVSTLSACSQTSPPAPPTTPVQLSPPTDAAAEGVTASGDVRDGCGVNRVPQRPSDIAEPPPLPPPPPPPPSGLAPVEAPPRGLVEGPAHPANVSGVGGDSITSRRTTDGVTALDADAVPQIPSTGSGYDVCAPVYVPYGREMGLRGGGARSAIVVVGSSGVSAGGSDGGGGVGSGTLGNRTLSWALRTAPAGLAAALAHTGDGSLSTASWLQPPPPVKPPPPSRNSVPQQQRPEQQQMLTQQLSESYGSESTVSTLQNMYGGSTGLRPQLQAGTWAAK
ncbi:hypothetical protein VOLCADRAFT_98731 [Volvox carteri f. nagariensis]|uniref:Uncharacterized protein n=1 Tax=Volvox carteri f. nagariensis TaxID=3068 RepID=D8UG52_VOLCA|nr:uncharacterized protein VOLCADRAFT_98731 [Volvox carteri f. nagariensis]EFJ41292.1 hypothetical protein VOLCADRAFT_98731 [Volvox carteri f. nagariensis]|eukprot:XP_002957626.1 hypothetical protein VOLCADRAFT_98731 [Volvox carteri f. nagariensis]